MSLFVLVECVGRPFQSVCAQCAGQSVTADKQLELALRLLCRFSKQRGLNVFDVRHETHLRQYG